MDESGENVPINNELLEILACPICKADVEYKNDEDFLYCEKDDIRYFKSAFKGDKCKKCDREMKYIKGEVLVCTKCQRWFPIIEDIPHMLPDELREDL